MTRGLRAAILISLTLAGTVAAEANDTAPSKQNGFYILGRLGTALPIDQDINSTVLGKGEYDPDDGFGLQGAIGYHLGDGWRAEVSYTYLEGEDGTAKFPGGFIPVVGLAGETNSQTVLFNILKTVGSVDTFLGTVHPFVGAGIGFSHLDRSDVRIVAPFPFPLIGETTDTVFAAALHLGYDSQLAPGITLTSQWSFQWADEAEFRSGFFGSDLTRDSQVQIMTFTGIRIDLN